MIRIGNFSKLSQISIRTLRHYDEQGLLKPCSVDVASGYRYYSPDQLSVTHRIVALKSMGFSLTDIAEILQGNDDENLLQKQLLARLKEAQTQKKETESRIALIQATIDSLGEAQKMKYDVALKTIPARYVASIRRTIPSFDAEGVLWEELISRLNTMGKDVQLSGQPLPLAIYHDEGYVDSNIDVEIQVSVTGKPGVHKDDGDLVFKAVDSIEVASAIYKGSYDQSYAVHEAVAQWIAANDYEYAGPAINILHVSPDTEPNPAKWVTEVCFPVAKVVGD